MRGARAIPVRYSLLFYVKTLMRVEDPRDGGTRLSRNYWRQWTRELPQKSRAAHNVCMCDGPVEKFCPDSIGGPRENSARGLFSLGGWLAHSIPRAVRDVGDFCLCMRVHAAQEEER